MKVYIAGKITGNPFYKEQFKKAELDLRLKGHKVLNPADTVARIDGLKHEEYLHICLAMIDVAEAVALLPNWKDSKGAKIEFLHARKNGKEIILLEE